MRQIFKLKRIRILLLLPIAYSLNFIAYKSINFSEWYAVKIYPFISLTINHITSLFSFSIAEFLVIFTFIAVITYIVLYIVKFIKYKFDRKINTIKFVLNPICIVSVIYFIFIIFCGTNYHRMTFAEKNGLKIIASPKNELIDLCTELAEQANVLRGQVEVDSNYIMKLGEYDVSNEARITYAKMSDNFGLIANYGSPKSVFFSKFMSYSNITGVFFPFTFEANVNVDIPPYSIPSTMCHELTHLRGYMREDEANFISYIACIQSDNIDFQYSGTMLAYIYASNALYKTDKDAYLEIKDKLNKDVKKDLTYNNVYWQQFDGGIANISNKVNDTYLKVNSQEDGVKSYGRIVDLLLANRRVKKIESVN